MDKLGKGKRYEIIKSNIIEGNHLLEKILLAGMEHNLNYVS